VVINCAVCLKPAEMAELLVAAEVQVNSNYRESSLSSHSHRGVLAATSGVFVCVLGAGVGWLGRFLCRIASSSKSRWVFPGAGLRVPGAAYPGLGQTSPPCASRAAHRCSPTLPSAVRYPGVQTRWVCAAGGVCGGGHWKGPEVKASC